MRQKYCYSKDDYNMKNKHELYVFLSGSHVLFFTTGLFLNIRTNVLNIYAHITHKNSPDIHNLRVHYF